MSTKTAPSVRRLLVTVRQAQDAHRRLNAERTWMREHGDTQAAYVARYGSKNDPDHYGDGGEAIYAADKAALDARQADYEAAMAAYEDAVTYHVEVRDTEHDEATTQDRVNAAIDHALGQS